MKIGDVVTLKSGGPLMVINNINFFLKEEKFSWYNFFFGDMKRNYSDDINFVECVYINEKNGSPEKIYLSPQTLKVKEG